VAARFERFSRPLGWLGPAVLVGSLLPFAVIAWRAWRGALGANPIATALNQLGLLALIFLVSSLACTPLKLVFGWTWPLRLRKQLGLFGFFTALAHFSTYVVLDQQLALGTLVADVAKRPFIAFGFAALVILIPVAWTSGKDAPKRLGYARWKRIHWLVYPAAVLACLHFLVRVKADLREPAIYAGFVAILLLVRVAAKLRDRLRARAVE
jgi:sulfoxide reductase heme-binding subunit YedZ